MKPKLVHEVLRQSSPRKLYGSNLLPPNRYNVLSRDSSPADSVRSSFSQISVSTKRKNSANEGYSGPVSTVTGTGISYAEATGGDNASSTQVIIDCEAVTENIVKVKSICDKVSAEISKADIDPALVAIFGYINEALFGICDNQLQVTNLCKAKNTLVDSFPPADQGVKRFRAESNQVQKKQGNIAPTMVDLSTLRQKTNTQVEDPSVKKFKEAVKDAEKSTLVFNLNLGKVPIINHDTISTNATKALTEMAASVEKSKTKVPSTETMSALDDVLSVVKGMKFFGRSTRSYQRSNDPNSGSYCTVPIKYEFGNKDERIFAETVLRDKCKVNCTVPYPTILRETIRQVINGVKVHYPDYFVKVTVDTGRMCLNVSMRPKLAPGSTDEKCWYSLDQPVPIPQECLDIYARKVPDNFKVNHEFSRNSRSSQIQVQTMDTDQSTAIIDQASGEAQSARKSPVSKSPGKNAARQLQV
jgi:hypothetical protein